MIQILHSVILNWICIISLKHQKHCPSACIHSINFSSSFYYITITKVGLVRTFVCTIKLRLKLLHIQWCQRTRTKNWYFFRVRFMRHLKCHCCILRPWSERTCMGIEGETGHKTIALMEWREHFCLIVNFLMKNYHALLFH